MIDRTETAEAFLSAALEERVGGHHPPDLTERILSRAGEPARRRPRSLLAAATLLLGGGVLAAVFLWPRSAGDDAAAVEQDPEQDRAPLEIVQPADPEDWRRLLADTRAISARVLVLPGSRIRIAGVGRPATPAVPLADGARAKALAGVLAKLEPRGYDGAWEVSHALRLRLGGVRAVLLELQCTSRPWVAHVPDLGFALVDPDLQALLGPEIEQANRRTKIATGIVGADDLEGGRYALLGDDVTVLRPYELAASQIDVVLRYRHLKELDLRGSPAVNEPAILARLAALPDLATLCLDASWLVPEDVGALSGLPSLSELRLAAPNARGAGDGALDTRVVRAVLGLSLPAVALPGEMVTDEQIELLAKSTALRSLDLSRVGLGAGSVTPSGLAALRSTSLRGLVLDGWFAERAGFGFTGLGQFTDTDGDGLPDTLVRRVGQRAPLDPASAKVLADLVCRSSLRALSLRECTALGYDDVSSWKGSIDLDRLDLTGCPRFTREQIDELRAASPACRIIW